MESMELEALANDIDDVSDPSSIDKVLIYFEEIQQEAEEYVELLFKKLKYREITWEQPWYQQGTASVTRQCLPFYERNKFDEEKFRTDKMTKDEHDRISKNWKKFTKKYNVPDKLNIFVSWKKPGSRRKDCPEKYVRTFIAAYLARGVPRTLQQVYIYIQNYHLKEQEKVAYNKYEEKIMEVCFLHKLDRAPPILAAVLGRHVRGLYNRRTVLKTGKPEKKREKWTLDRAEKFLKGMLQYSELSLDELKYKTFDKSFWLKLQEAMDRDYTTLHIFWYCYLHVQLFVKCDLKLYKLRRKLFKLLRDSPYKVWSDIKWAELVNHFPDGVTVRFLYKMSVSIVRKHPKYLKAPLIDLANHGLQTIKSSRYANKRLRRLTLNSEGNLEAIKYNPDEQNS